MPGWKRRGKEGKEAITAKKKRGPVGQRRCITSTSPRGLAVCVERMGCITLKRWLVTSAEL